MSAAGLAVPAVVQPDSPVAERAAGDHVEPVQQVLAEEARGELPRKIDEIPYDFSRKRLSVIVEDEGGHLLITKGAFAPLLDPRKGFLRFSREG